MIRHLRVYVNTDCFNRFENKIEGTKLGEFRTRYESWRTWEDEYNQIIDALILQRLIKNYFKK